MFQCAGFDQKLLVMNDIAKSLEVILNHLEHHRWISFSKDDSPETFKAKDKLRAYGLIEEYKRYSWRLTKEGYNAIALGGFEAWYDREQQVSGEHGKSTERSPNKMFTEAEKEDINSNIDKVLSRLNELQLGQEIVYNEIDELRNLLMLEKKNWRQLLKGKLVDLGLEKTLDTETLAWVYNSLTGENLNLLN
jgi:hypothetical protein